MFPRYVKVPGSSAGSSEGEEDRSMKYEGRALKGTKGPRGSEGDYVEGMGERGEVSLVLHLVPV